MTILLDNRRTDRKPQAPRREGPYYPVDAMKRLAAAPEAKPSIVARVTEYFDALTDLQWWFVMGVILAALTIAVGIVTW